MGYRIQRCIEGGRYGAACAVLGCWVVAGFVLPSRAAATAGDGEPPETARASYQHPLLSDAQAQRPVTLQFRDAPLDQVLTFYAELVGRTLLVAPQLQASITLRGMPGMAAGEALHAIESLLAMHNVGLVPMGERFLKVVQLPAVRQEALPIRTAPPEEPFPETDGIVSQVFVLRHIELAEAQPIIQGLMHAYGKMQPLERINGLLITETAANLQRIREILDLLDQPIETRIETRIYELRYAPAAEIAARLNELAQESQTRDTRARAAAPAPAPPPGVIRPRTQRQAPAAADMEKGLAERGIIQGPVKIVADERTATLIVMSMPANFAFFDQIVAVLDRPVEPDVVVRVWPLEYAKADEMAAMLNQLIGGSSTPARPQERGADDDGRSTALREFLDRRAEAAERILSDDERGRVGRLSADMKILADMRTNALLLMGTRADIAALEPVMAKLDIMLAQVLIEAVVLEVSLSKGIEYGMDWLQRSMTVYRDGGAGSITHADPLFSFGGGQRLSESAFRDGAAIDRNDPALSVGGLTYFATITDLNLDLVLRAAASSSDARILSTPVILTTDNTEAKIVVGEQRPVVTATSVSTAGQQTTSYQYRNIGLELTVTPRINPERVVVMDVVQTADNLGGFEIIDGNRVPIITKRQMQASITARSRSTIVMGGLVSTDRRSSGTKVPLLGDIPFLGRLFRSDSWQDNRTELLVMLTPYVLITPEEARTETHRLHRAAEAGQTEWRRGWSDSEFAQPESRRDRHERRTPNSPPPEFDADRAEPLRTRPESGALEWDSPVHR